MQRLLDAMTMVPAYVRNGHLDVRGTNPLGRAALGTLSDVFATARARIVTFDNPLQSRTATATIYLAQMP